MKKRNGGLPGYAYIHDATVTGNAAVTAATAAAAIDKVEIGALYSHPALLLAKPF